MKKLFLGLLSLSTVTMLAQPKKGKDMSMTPEFAKGYYLTLKGDTVKGEVQYNLTKEDAFYKSFFFRPKAGAKPQELTPKKAKGYGYDNNNFTVLKMDENDVYIKFVEKGRLNLLEYKHSKLENDVETFPAVYFIIDSKAPANDKNETNILTQLPDRNHKKVLSKFFKDQPILLDQVDKWYFKIDEIRKATQEFNNMYAEGN